MTPTLMLKFPTDEELAALASLAADDIHPPNTTPFPITGWVPEPRDGRSRSLLRYHWRSRADWTVDLWNFVMVCIVDGSVAGTQAVGATSFAVTKAVTTGSWLHPQFQHRGVGTEMRRAVLQFVFAALYADVANSSAYEWNASSLRVSAKLGYEENGAAVRSVNGERALERHLLLRRDRWSHADDIVLHGVTTEALAMFGATEAS